MMEIEITVEIKILAVIQEQAAIDLAVEAEDLEAEVEAEARQKLATQTSEPVAESVPPAIDENPTHREDFKSLVDAAAQKQKQDD